MLCQAYLKYFHVLSFNFITYHVMILNYCSNLQH